VATLQAVEGSLRHDVIFCKEVLCNFILIQIATGMNLKRTLMILVGIVSGCIAAYFFSCSPSAILMF